MWFEIESSVLIDLTCVDLVDWKSSIRNSIKPHTVERERQCYENKWFSIAIISYNFNFMNHIIKILNEIKKK